MRILLFFAVAILLNPAAYAAQDTSAAARDIENFHPVSMDNSGEFMIFRGGRPTLLGLSDLKYLGVKTDISLQGGDIQSQVQLPGMPQGITNLLNSAIDSFVAHWEPGEKPSYIAQEQNLAMSLGMQFENHPLDSLNPITDAEANDIRGVLAIMADTSRQPVFVHCEHGLDRTGLIVALYRVCKEGVSPDTAYQEMISKGHNPNDHVTQATDIFFWRSVATGFCSR